MEEIKFTAHQLIVDSAAAQIDLLAAAFKEADDYYVEGEVHYHIEKEALLNKRYFWMSCSFGKQYPYTDHVYDIEANQFAENPRKTTQIEPNRQLFCLYDSVKEILYLSNSQKKKMVENYLKSQIEKDVIVKNFYVDADAFAQAINTIHAVKLITKKNLFSQQSGLFSESKDIFGLGEIEDFTLEARFKKAKKTPEFIQQFKNWAAKRGHGEIESLICVGFDDANIETVFNADAIIRKVPLYLEKDEQGLFKADDVKKAILSVLTKDANDVQNP